MQHRAGQASGRRGEGGRKLVAVFSRPRGNRPAATAGPSRRAMTKLRRPAMAGAVERPRKALRAAKNGGVETWQSRSL